MRSPATCIEGLTDDLYMQNVDEDVGLNSRSLSTVALTDVQNALFIPGPVQCLQSAHVTNGLYHITRQIQTTLTMLVSRLPELVITPGR